MSKDKVYWSGSVRSTWGTDSSYKVLKVGMIEGEYFVSGEIIDGYLHLKSNLGREWKSTNVNPEYLDLIEVT